MEIKNNVMLKLDFSDSLGMRKNLKPLNGQLIYAINKNAPQINVPWNIIQMDQHNYTHLCTVNPDPRFNLLYNDKCFLFKHFYDFLIENSSLLREYVCVMEEGKGKLHFHLIISCNNINAKTFTNNILRTYSTSNKYHHRTCMCTKIKDYKDKTSAQTLWIGEEKDILPDIKKYKSGYPYLVKENIDKALLYKKPLNKYFTLKSKK